VELTSSSKKRLKAIGHSINPIINVGKNEITESVINKVNNELDIHELVKIKIQKTSLTPVKDAIEKIASSTNSSIIRIIGSTGLLFRRNEENPVITL
jgi:RNA-binding protein